MSRKVFRLLSSPVPLRKFTNFTKTVSHANKFITISLKIEKFKHNTLMVYILQFINSSFYIIRLINY